MKKIHACWNNCVLFRGENEDLNNCPECGMSRYKRRKDGGDDGEDSMDERKKKGTPRKVAWYFPLVSRLQRMFANKKEAKLLCWHEEGRNKDGMLRHPADCAQWRHFDNTNGWFGDDPRNIMFALSTDGMNLYGNMSTSHSTWPVLLLIMNLPPWLCNKRKYIMLSTLVSGPKQPGDRIDVFLQPLIDDLQLLWHGVEVRDAVVNQHFTLHAMLMTTISDNPAHRNLSV